MRGAGQQAAADGDAVERDVGELADAGRQEPLERLVADAGDEGGEERRDDRRGVGPGAPDPQEQPGDQAELDEMDALDGADGRIGAARWPPSRPRPCASAAASAP